MYLHIPEKIERIQSGAADTTVIDALVEKYEGWLIVTHPKDYGPSTKLLGSLLVEKDPETIVITGTHPPHHPSIHPLYQNHYQNFQKLDDDMSYHPNIVKVLVGAIELHSDAIPCFICEMWYEGHSEYFNTEDFCDGWGNAFASMAYRVGYFDEEVFTYEGVPDGCKLHDDVYLSGWARRRGYRPYVIRPGFASIIGSEPHTNLSIHVVPNTEGGYRDPCIAYFNYFQG
ncbi:hypothetical protein BC829DRAFT_226643 [Chytridium lagenaria]|nr:hypothetical protein BC829DRAFT_226643 [Chytridium lagenaria]